MSQKEQGGMKINFVGEMETQMHFGKSRVKCLNFAVVDWKKYIGEMFLIEDKAKEYLLRALGKKKVNDYVYCFNTYYYKYNTKNNKFTILGWFLGQYNTFDKFQMFAFVDSGIDFELVVKQFQIYAIPKDVYLKHSKKRRRLLVGEDEKNDCLYYSLANAVGGHENLPSKINNPRKLKKVFGVDRNDKFPLFKHIDELQDILKCSIIVKGKAQYIPDEIKPRNITLYYDNGHIRAGCNEGKDKPIFYKEFDEDNIIFVYNDHTQRKKYKLVQGKLKVINFDDNIPDKNTLDIVVKDLIDESDIKKSLKIERDEYIRKADDLKRLTNNIINFKKFFSIPTMAYEIFRLLSKDVRTPEEIQQFEQVALSEANYGGIHHSIEGVYDNCCDIDINNMYLHYMSSKEFTLPFNVGRKELITTEEMKNKKFFSYGLYKCRIDGNSIWINKKVCDDIFKWVPHFTLTIALKEGLKIEMYDEDEYNAIIYDRNRLNGNLIFGKFAHEALNIRDKTKDTEYEKEGKLFGNSLWGHLCMKNREKVEIPHVEKFDITEFDVEELIPTEEKFIIKHIDKVKTFKYSFARIGCFLTSFCTLQLYNDVRNNNIEDKNIVLMNTDGLVLKDGASFSKSYFSSKPGFYKYAKCKKDKTTIMKNVKVCVKNCNNYYSI